MLEQATASELIIVAAKPVVLEKDSERWRRVVALTEQGIVGGYAVCTKKQDCETRGSMAIIELPVALKNFEESEGLNMSPVSAAGILTRIDMRNPSIEG